MRAKGYLVLISVLLILAVPYLAMAVDVHDFDCSECHMSGLTINELGGSNVCLTCHGSPTNGPADGFATGDASAHYGNNPAPGDETSHNWAATSTNPDAGASEPNRTLHPGFYSRQGTTVGKVACSRCHNPHGQLETNPKLLPLVNPRAATPMTPNDMCLACHKDFDVGAAAHGLLSHPIGMVYDEAAPGFQPIDNGVAGELALMGDGTISCTTCHGVHATDSDATTKDGFATDSNPGAGDGLLLKHNGPTNEDPAAADGICQACHVYEGHGMSSTNSLGCMVCHGGHEYDPNNLPNYYMLKKQVTLPVVPSTGLPGTINLDYTVDPTTTANYDNGTGVKGALCLNCHALPGTHAAGDNCADCHSHDSTSGSFGAGCGSCHGYAPYLNAQGNLTSGGFAFSTATGNDYSASPAFKDESATPHARHANGSGNYTFGCSNCHGEDSGDLSHTTSTNHDNNDFQQVLDNAIGTLPSLTTAGGALVPAYNIAAPGSCSAVYCHSNGRVQGRPESVLPTTVTVSPWAAGAGTIGSCGVCHDVQVGGGKNHSPSHNAHLNKGYACGLCHVATSADGSSLVAAAIGGEHVNGTADLTFSGLAATTAPVPYDDTQGTCGVYCHTNGKGTNPTTPDWDDAATGQCGDCHGGPVGTESSPGVLSEIASGSHTKHLNAGLSCDDCHGAGAITGTHAGHVDGDGPNNYDLVVDCKTCHGATAGATVGADREPIWGNSASVDCETCHVGSVVSSFVSTNVALNGKTAPDKDLALSTGHNLASGNYAVTNNTAAAQACTSCHDGAVPGGHFDGVSGDDSRLTAGFQCLDCHDGSSAVQVATHSNVGDTFQDYADFTQVCSACHDPHGDATNAAMINLAGVAFTAHTGANSFDEAESGAGVNADDICATCHTLTTHNFNNATPVPAGDHQVGNDCMPCHAHGGGFMPTGGNSCEDCHSAKLAEPRHVAHITINNPDIDTDKSECAICHPSVAGYTIAGGSPDHFSNSANDFAAGITNPQAAGTTCSSAMGCHQSSVADGSWQDSNGLNCDSCHYQAADPTQAGNTGNVNPISAGHNAHFNGGGAVVCTDCHDAVTDTSHISNAGGTDGVVLNDQANALPTEATILASATFDAGALTCATASCHNDARPGDAVVTPAWDFDAPNCTQCHAAAPSTGSHDIHLPAATDCSDCHTSALQDTSYNSTNHFDSNIDVAVGSYTADKGINTAFESCDAPSCHDDGRAPDATPDWGTSVTTCLACHEAVPSTGSHASHVADAAVTCDDCHTGAVEETTAPTAGHQDGNIDVTGGSGYPTNRALTSAFTNCTTASCHDDGRNSGVTQDWGTTVNNCAECHATIPATGGHGAHVGVSFSGAAIACGDCHTGAIQGTTEPTANHRDGDVNAAGYPVQAIGSAFTTCTTATCHQTGQAANDYTETPAWDADTANCSQCHEASPTTNSHAKHIVMTSDCATCHTSAVIDTSYASAQHGDLNIDVAVGGYTANKALGSALESCSINCHSDGLAATGTSPVWGTAGGACDVCHLSDMITGSHGAHLADGATCGDCHDGAVKDSNAGTAHTDGDVDVIASYATADAAYGMASWTTCSAASCHDDGRAPNVTATWGTTVNNCAECHATQPATGSHTAHLSDGATCGDCHTGSVEGTTAPTANHRDGNVNAGSGYPVQANGSAFTNCTTASCHNDGRNGGVTQDWNTTVNNCAECHATIPATGGHGAHLGVTFAGAAIACGDCHAGAVQGSTAPTANHRDGDVNAAGYPVQANGSAFTTCTTATCHQTGQAANDYTETPAWDVDTANCSQCHDASPTTGSHAKHIVATSATTQCATCHTGALIDTSYASAQHGDLNIDVSVGNYPGNKALGSAYQGCDSISCHGDGLGNIIPTTPAWGATAGCAACHGVPATGSHAIHLTETSDSCVECHKGADVAGGTLSDEHSDNNIDVYITNPGDLGYTVDAAIGIASWSTCNAASCHDKGRGGLATTPAWGTTSACAECHALQPATGSHTSHLGASVFGSAIACADCHTGVTEGTTANATDHRDTNIDTAVALGYTQNKDKDTAFESCGTVNCHSNGLTATGSTPNWGTAGDCTTCHASNMTSGSHTIHLADGAACGDCHDGATKDSNPGTAHIDGNVDAIAGYATANAAYGAGSYTTCNAASCHDNGTGTLVTTPDWGTTANCTECHTTVPATAAHTTHLTQTISTAFTLNCTDCHDGAVWGSSATTTGHRDGNVDVTGGYGYPADAGKGAPYNTCATTYCHGDNMPKNTTSGTTNNPNWGATSTGCTFCHDVAAVPVAIAAHDGKTFANCIDCHGPGKGDVNAAGDGFTNGGATHIDGTLQGGGDSCSDCHFNVGTALPGAHAAHNNVAYTGLLSTGDYGNAANGWYDVTYVNGVPSFACGYCHPSTVAGHMTKQVSLDPTDANAAGTVKAMNDAGAAYAGSGGACSATYCHSDGVNVAAGTSPNWSGGSISGNCNDCHGNSPTTAAHGAHEVGIHYEELYDKNNGGLLPAAGAVGSGAAHGDTDISSTITCFTCHKNTVIDSANATNSTCAGCHSTGGVLAQGDGVARILTTSSTHLNGVKDVAFADLSNFKSPAQLRDNLADADDGTNLLSDIWNRITGYKGGTDYDSAQAAFATPSFTQGPDTCSTTACHNGNVATWSDSGVDCMYCHTSLPK